MDTITVNGEVYERVKKPSDIQGRAVFVIDRGWIYAGDWRLQEDGMGGYNYVLTRIVWVFAWKDVGFMAVVDNPKHPQADLRKSEVTLVVPVRSVIFRIPVADDWGLTQ